MFIREFAFFHRFPDAMRFLSYFSTTIPPGDLYTFGSESKRRASCERQKKTEGGERRVDVEVERITMQLFSFQLVNRF